MPDPELTPREAALVNLIKVQHSLIDGYKWAVADLASQLDAADRAAVWVRDRRMVLAMAGQVADELGLTSGEQVWRGTMLAAEARRRIASELATAHEWPHSRIARAFGCEQATVYNLINRARRRRRTREVQP